MIHPWCHNHTGLPLLKLSHCTPNHIPHAVDQAHGECCSALQRYIHCFFRHEFRLCCHNGAATSRLRQLINGSFPAVDVINIGDHTSLHKAFDESGLSRPYRTKHTNEQRTARPGGNILIKICICHSYLPCARDANFIVNLHGREASLLSLLCQLYDSLAVNIPAGDASFH